MAVRPPGSTGGRGVDGGDAGGAVGSLSRAGNPARLPGVSGGVEPIEQARRIREVFGTVQPELGEVEAFFTRELESALPMIREVAGWVLGGGGKRIRPALLLLISRMLGYSGHRAVRYGAVVELIHTATLIHDDIIDESELRRGRATANRRWGSQAAVLVGDWLYTRTMDLCLELGDVEVMRLLTSATLRMIEGEILADQVRRRVDIDESTYMDITRRKTAELFAAACALPALFQPSTLHLTGQLATFGRSLGLCFQLIDDVLDYTATVGAGQAGDGGSPGGAGHPAAHPAPAPPQPRAAPTHRLGGPGRCLRGHGGG